MDSHAFLGQGWSFPVTTDETNGRIRLCSYSDDIAEAITLILRTRKGERVMRADFGSMMHTFAFESLSLSAKTGMLEEIKNALILWEPRIENIEASIEETGHEGCVRLLVSYVIRGTNSPYNLVFPFYIREGTYEAL